MENNQPFKLKIEWDGKDNYFTVDIQYKDGSSTSVSSRSEIGAVLQAIHLMGGLTATEIDPYIRIHDDHTEIIDVMVLDSIEKTLLFAKRILEEYYTKKKNGTQEI